VTVRAFAVSEFGEAASIREVADPDVGPGEVLIKVKSAGMNTTDLAVMAGYMAQFVPHVFPVVLGIDASGVIEKVGEGADGFAVGDEVYGYVLRQVMGMGTLADRVSLPIGGILRKPAAWTFEQAAVIGHSSLTALAMVEAAKVGPGQTIVLIGATGGVGSFATQLVTKAGAKVLAVTRSDHAAYARSLGASEVIDYEVGDPVESVKAHAPGGIDAVLDAAGMPALLDAMASIVTSGGHVVSVVIPPDVDGLALRGVTGVLASRFATDGRLAEIGRRLESGELQLPTVHAFDFSEVGTALDLQGTRHVQGKLAIRIS
jgi:NADPH:quinone reductase-like Zn-dependent oxidoreductase